MPINTTLHTARTTLTLLTEADLPAMEALAREPDTFKYIKKLRVMTPEQYTRFLYTKLEQILTGAGYHWAVWLHADSSSGPATVSPDPTQASSTHFIGAVNLNPIKGPGAPADPASPARLQIGCQLKRDYWGQGFASELTTRLLHFAIHELKLPAVYGVFEQDNYISRRLLEKLGFVFEKSFQEQELIIEVHAYISPLAGSHQLNL
ncbi:MAG TPA: GNAT family N-acetyltransferase [Puia sp.]|nr:GNAT family N-acetyltransferase [Puia sp.]